MIKGADRKEGSKILQFRASSEYNGMIELITQALNKKIAEVGSKEKITTTDIMKLSIECLVTGNNSFNILGKNIKIDELVSSELESFDREYSNIIPNGLIEFEIKCSLINIIKEIVELLEDIQISDDSRKLKEIEEDIIMLKAILFSREEFFYSIKASKEEKEAMSFTKVESIEYYLNIIGEKYEELDLKVEEIDFEELKNKIEDNILAYEKFKNIKALKLYDNYKYSYILNSLRNEINSYIKYIEDTLTKKNEAFIENEREKNQRYFMDIDNYEEDDIDDYSMFKSEYDLRPGDEGYEFSIAEAIDNMYDK